VYPKVSGLAAWSENCKMVELSATRCSYIAILWVSLMRSAAMTIYVASQRVIPNMSVYFFIDSVRKLLVTLSYTLHSGDTSSPDKHLWISTLLTPSDHKNGTALYSSLLQIDNFAVVFTNPLQLTYRIQGHLGRCFHTSTHEFQCYQLLAVENSPAAGGKKKEIANTFKCP
jgi:hypothetical protein